MLGAPNLGHVLAREAETFASPLIGKRWMAHASRYGEKIRPELRKILLRNPREYCKHTPNSSAPWGP